MRTLLCWFVLVPSLAFALTPDSIPAPHANSWIVDLTGRIPAVDIAAANALAESANSRKLGQVAVLVVDSLDGRDPKDFAQQVHRSWNIGTGRGDGILYFVALKDRAAETVLPFGLRSREDQTRSGEVMSQVIMPAFKRGAQGEAIREGTRALVALLEKSPLNTAQSPDSRSAAAMNQGHQRAVRSPVQLPTPAARGFAVDAAGVMSPRQLTDLDAALNGIYADGKGKLYVYVVRASDFEVSLASAAYTLLERLHPAKTPGVQVATLAVDRQSAAIAGQSLMPSANGWAIEQLLEQTQEDLQNSADLGQAMVAFAHRYESLVTRGPALTHYTARASSNVARSIERNSFAFGLGGLGFVGGGMFGLMRFLRFRKRRCKTCGDHRLRLSEEGDDKHLSEGQTHEEGLHSVDYDVWWCTRCADALVLRYKAFFTSYKTCPNCSFVCAMQTTNTLVHASYSSGGQVEVNLNCNRCNHHSSHVRYTPKLTRSTTTSSSRSSFGGGNRGGGSSFGGSSGRW